MKRVSVISAAVVSVIISALFFHAPLFAQVQKWSNEPHSEVDTTFGCKANEILCIAPQFALPAEQLATLAPPPYERASVKTVSYVVETRGIVSVDTAEFKQRVAETLQDSRGWVRLGITFREVSSGGDFTVVLSEAAQVPSFSSGCDSTYSCNVGRFVIINQDRWLGATPAWNQGGGSLRDYQHMVLNHETGHWLGHGHTNCAGAGQPAAVMQQQSIALQGCVFNPWPLKSELHSSTLGI